MEEMSKDYMKKIKCIKGSLLINQLEEWVNKNNLINITLQLRLRDVHMMKLKILLIDYILKEEKAPKGNIIFIIKINIGGANYRINIIMLIKKR
jgi:hypothetical protein